MKRLFALALLALSSMKAQDPRITLPVIREQWDELQQFLVLSAAQLASLQQIQAERQKAEQAVYQQIFDKERQLYTLLEQGSNDATAIGRLMVDINDLRKQLPLNAGPYKTQALAVLNDAQKAKLPTLAAALQQQTTAWQAVQLNLLDRPAPDTRILPFPMPAVELPSISSSAAARGVQ